MADTSGAGDGSGAEKRRAQMEASAESVGLKFIARWMMAVGVPLFLTVLASVGAWFATRMIAATDASTAATIRLEERVTNLIQSQIPQITSTLNSRIDAHTQRLDGLDRRFDAQDRRDQGQDIKIEDTQRRVWGMPATAPSAPMPAPHSAPEQPSIRPYPR